MRDTEVGLVLPNCSLTVKQISTILGVQPKQTAKLPLWSFSSGEDGAAEPLIERWIDLLERVIEQLTPADEDGLDAYLELRLFKHECNINSELSKRLGALNVSLSFWFEPIGVSPMSAGEHASSVVISLGKFFSKADERNFFDWLRNIDGVVDIEGETPSNLRIYLSAVHMEEHSLRDLIALLHRYAIPMSGLKEQLTEDNQHWFKDPTKFWYESVFGVR
ncbi:MAG TPA: hypothetical protein V6C76_13935 [Drouetiella sp.]